MSENNKDYVYTAQELKEEYDNMREIMKEKYDRMVDEKDLKYSTDMIGALNWMERIEYRADVMQEYLQRELDNWIIKCKNEHGADKCNMIGFLKSVMKNYEEEKKRAKKYFSLCMINTSQI